MSIASNITRILLSLPVATALAQDSVQSPRICLAPTNARMVTGNTVTSLVEKASEAIAAVVAKGGK